jgi:hypothetical protein
MFGYFLSTSQQEVSADIIQNSKIQLLVETSIQTQKEQRQKQQDVSFFGWLFPSCRFSILCNLLIMYTVHFAKFVCLLKRLQRLKQEWQKSPAGTSKHTAKTRFGLEK